MELASRRLRASSNSKKCKKTLLVMETRPAVCASRRKGAGMKRREFIALLGGAAAAWPLAARAQLPEGVRQIGVLMGLAEDDPDTKARLFGLGQGLEKLGWVEGRNVRIDYRFAPAGARAPELAKELVALRPDVILSN